jgi:hypothetical protein
MSGLLSGIVLSVCTYWFHKMVTLPPRLVSIIIIIHEVVLSNTRRRQKTASNEQQPAADNEHLWGVFPITLTEILLPSSLQRQFIHNEDKRTSEWFT